MSYPEEMLPLVKALDEAVATFEFVDKAGLPYCLLTYIVNMMREIGFQDEEIDTRLRDLIGFVLFKEGPEETRCEKKS